MFDQETFDNLEKIAPFVKNYCIISKISENNYYSNLIIRNLLDKDPDLIIPAFSEIKQKVTIDKVIHYDKLIFPKHVVILYTKNFDTYSVDLRGWNLDELIILGDGNTYSLEYAIMRFSKSRFSIKTQVKSNIEIEEHISDLHFTKQRYDFVSVLVLGKNLD